MRFNLLRSFFAQHPKHVVLPQRGQKSPRPHLIKRHFLVSSFSSLVFLLILTSCSDFISPVKSTPEPTEYSFNYWLLQNLYLYEEELPNLPEDGDSVQILYNTLKDPYTNYTPPAKSEDAITSSTTSIIAGDIGMRYQTDTNLEHPVIISRVYPQGPAGRAGVPRYGVIISANDIELTGNRAKSTYDSIVNHSKKVDIRVASKGDTSLYQLTKEDVYAPTVFVDTLYEDKANGYPGIVFVSIERFKLVTADKKHGTYGELKAYLDSTTSDKRVRILDLRNNPGGHIVQCISMADLFVKEGNLSTRKARSLRADGSSAHVTVTEKAKAGDVGETGKYLLYANRGSASCSEIFIAAITETTDIPLAGGKTYGKGIGQSMFSTYAGGLANITDIQFLTPKGNSYNGIGIIPQYTCDDDIIDNYCAAKIASKIYNVKIPKQKQNALAKRHFEQIEDTTNLEIKGEAVEWGVIP